MSEDPYAAGNVRTSVRAFAIGKALTAPTSFLLLFLMVGLMPRAEYAAYVAVAAAFEVAMAFGSFGVGWLAQTALPNIRVNGTRPQLRRAIGVLAALQAGSYLLMGTAFVIGAQYLSDMLAGVTPPLVIRIYGAVVLVEGVARMVRDTMLPAFLLQRIVQVLQLLRLAVLMGVVLGMYAFGATISAATVALAELGASTATLSIAAVSLLRYVRTAPMKPGEERSIREWFGLPALRMSMHAYGSWMLTMCMSTDVATPIVARLLGADATAQFGFVTRLVDQLRRTLPMDLLWSIICPAAIGRYNSSGKRFPVLRGDVAMIIRANMIVLGGVLALFAAAGDEAVRIATADRMHLAPLLLATQALTNVCHSIRRPLELITFVTSTSELFLRGSFAALVAPVLMFSLLSAHAEIYWIAVSLIVADLLFSGIVFSGLLRRGFSFDIDPWPWVKLAVAVVGSAALGAAFVRGWPGIPGVVIGGTLAAIGYLALLAGLKVVTREDVERVVTLVKSRRASAPA